MMHEVLKSVFSLFSSCCCGKIGAFAHSYHINGVQCRTHVCKFLKLFLPHISLPSFVAFFLEAIEKEYVHTHADARTHTESFNVALHAIICVDNFCWSHVFSNHLIEYPYHAC